MESWLVGKVLKVKMLESRVMSSQWFWIRRPSLARTVARV